MVSVRNEEENAAVKSLLDRNGVKSAMIGGYGKKGETPWSWIDGSEFTFANWRNSWYSNIFGHPNGYYIRVYSFEDDLYWYNLQGRRQNWAVYRLPSNYADWP